MPRVDAVHGEHRVGEPERADKNTRLGRGYRNHVYLFKKLRFITANPVRNSAGIKRFLALGLPAPTTRAA